MNCEAIFCKPVLADELWKQLAPEIAARLCSFAIKGLFCEALKVSLEEIVQGRG